MQELSIEEFRKLDELDQVSAIMQHGKLLAQNVENNARVFLYRMDKFYASVTWSRPADMLTGIVCFLEVEQELPHSRKKLFSIHPASREYETPEA